MIRYGVVGSGWITDSFIKGAAALTLTAVYSRTEERAQAYAAQHGAAHAFTNIEEMACSPFLDAVYIASPNSAHAAQCRLFLQHGKHVICEKPLTAELSRTQALVALAAEKKLIFMEAIMFLHLPQLAILEQAVARLGHITMARFDFCQLSSRYAAFCAGELPNIFNPLYETGAFMDLGVYCVYPALYLFGHPVRLHADAALLSTGADGAGSAIFAYEDKQAVLTYSKIGQGQAGSEIIGDKGTLTIASISKLENMVLTEVGKPPVTLWEGEEKHQLMGYEATAFSRFIEGKDPEKYARCTALALEVAETMQEVRRQAGIVFPEDHPPVSDK